MRITVLGAGILGSSAAFHAARAGADVVVVDHAHAGRATAASAGIICPWANEHGDPEYKSLLLRGGAYYATLIEALAGRETGYRRVGALCVADNAAELGAIEHMVRERATAEAGDVSRLGPADTRALFPPLHPELGAVWIEGGARVDGRLLAGALLDAARANGATVRAGLARVVTTKGRVNGVALGSEMIAADVVIVAAGAWAPSLLEPLGVKLMVTPQRGQIVHLQIPGQTAETWPIVLQRSSHYLLAFDDARVVVGATRESRVGFDCRATAAGQVEVLQQALAAAPGLADATVLETRVGLRPVGPDARPLLGAVGGLPGLLIGNGLGASGMTIGPLAGRMLAEVALGQQQTAFDLAPYDPLRCIGLNCADFS